MLKYEHYLTCQTIGTYLYRTITLMYIIQDYVRAVTSK